VQVASYVVKVSLMLADHAQAVGGKLYITGGGWSVTGPDPVPFAIALDVKVPWHAIDVEHELRLELLDADGAPVEVETPQGSEPLVFETTFGVAPTAGAKPGTPIDFAFAINLAPQPAIEPGGRYEWRLTIDGETREDWHLAFSTRPADTAS
jgi:hypothetical protein